MNERINRRIKWKSPISVRAGNTLFENEWANIHFHCDTVEMSVKLISIDALKYSETRSIAQ
jgi:hypothetical protein